ncbi:hypothetical protein M409DRAFT_54411 [Zasmidium cellare ATCC 36951]|uniref:FAS1 domain-containing protein n=1 Tax=Zasmidium cellare ATCC 36951 TaxID=1080233 RepID=A0A6A6CJA2_ZASCE|nr:uncharacterized protein M409DRAFT_54411 [Zasmidium cellare ATCC 36951]KAF2167225.1 hypothetical protein M409DRAFT_54411 [Zasmidium cellare ATCC 36951]
MHHFQTLLAILSLLNLTTCQSLVELIQSQPDLTTLLTALNAVPRFTNHLASLHDITILAPTNAAFAKVPPRSPLGEALAQAALATPENPAPGPVRAGIRALLAYHVLKGVYPASSAGETPVFVPTVLDSSFEVGGVSVANVSGGQNVGVKADGGGVEIISGGLAMSRVVQADIQAPNNVIVHRIDTLLQLPVNVTTTGSATGNTAMVDALKQTGLDDTLDAVADLTVFIPNNQAFEAAQSVIQGADVQTLVKVLSYHAVVGDVLFSSELCRGKLKTVEGSKVKVTVSGDGVFVDSARVVVPDIILSDRVGHFIDGILMPSD